MRIPPVVKTLLLLNIVAFILDSLSPMFLGGHTLGELCGLYYIFDPYGRFHLYQFVTYMFMHGSLSHLFFNMFALWMFGRVMEQVWGARRFLTYYLLCGIGAGLVQELCQLFGVLHPLVNTIGASGAVYGILLAFGMTFPNERLFIIPIPFPIKAKYFVMFYAVVEIFEGLGSHDGVAHFAHLGGMFFGLVLILYWRNKVRRRRFEGENFWTADTSYDSGGDNYDKGESFFDKLKKFFGGDGKRSAKKPKMTVSYGNGDRAKDYDYNARKKENAEEIDRILDKVRKNGYANLTTEEKNKLFDASKR